MIFELNDNNPEHEYSLKNGIYEITLFKDYDPAVSSFTHSYTHEFDTIPFSGLPDSFKTATTNEIYNQQFQIEITERTKATLTVVERKVEDSSLIKKYTYIFRGIRKHKWHTSVGLAGAIKLNSDSYKTQALDDKFQIVEDGSQELFGPIPVIQFTYLNIEKDTWFGPTGGIGFDTSNFSVFGGYSLYVGHNFIITAGVVFHKQKRLNNSFDVNQIVSEQLSSEDLNTGYYRLNPFFSLSYSLSKNIFKP